MSGGVYPAHNAPVAQWIECLASDQEVAGSTPAGRIMGGRPEGWGFATESKYNYYKGGGIPPKAVTIPSRGKFGRGDKCNNIIY